MVKTALENMELQLRSIQWGSEGSTQPPVKSSTVLLGDSTPPVGPKDTTHKPLEDFLWVFFFFSFLVIQTIVVKGKENASPV